MCKTPEVTGSLLIEGLIAYHNSDVRIFFHVSGFNLVQWARE